VSTSTRRIEPSRTRECGTVVTNPAQEPDAGQARIAALRAIVRECQYAKIDGVMVDLFTASAIVKVYDAINPENQAMYRVRTVDRMASIAFDLLS
jgi:hypothetical protein